MQGAPSPKSSKIKIPCVNCEDNYVMVQWPQSAMRDKVRNLCGFCASTVIAAMKKAGWETIKDEEIYRSF